MDTFKDRQQLDDMVARGEAPWEVWKTSKTLESQNVGDPMTLQTPSQVTLHHA
jgi:hypothetical protein